MLATWMWRHLQYFTLLKNFCANFKQTKRSRTQSLTKCLVFNIQGFKSMLFLTPPGKLYAWPITLIYRTQKGRKSVLNNSFLVLTCYAIKIPFGECFIRFFKNSKAFFWKLHWICKKKPSCPSASATPVVSTKNCSLPNYWP